MSDWKQRLGILYSTDPNYQYDLNLEEDEQTVVPDKQPLLVSLSRKQRAGKEVTLIGGFIGAAKDLEELGKTLKKKCGVGGSSKDGEILIQGDHRERILLLLHELGYSRAKRGN